MPGKKLVLRKYARIIIGETLAGGNSAFKDNKKNCIHSDFGLNLKMK